VLVADDDADIVRFVEMYLRLGARKSAVGSELRLR
jgi:hypothetical protein